MQLAGDDFIQGFVQRDDNGGYSGRITIDGVDLSPISAVLFEKDGEKLLWLQRKPIMDYNDETGAYTERARRPFWQCYLRKTCDDNGVAFDGEFMFLKFKYNIKGVWDTVFGMEKQRLNLFVERASSDKQTLLNAINERKRRMHGEKQ